LAEKQEEITAEQLGVAFDLSTMTAQDYHNYNAAARKDDTPAISKIFAKLVVKCPEKWGKPDEAATYMKLPMFGDYKLLMRAFAAAVRDEAGK